MSIATKICLILVILAGGFGIFQGAVSIPPKISKLKDEKAASDMRVGTAENAKKAIEKDRDSFKTEAENQRVEVETQKTLVKAEQDKIAPLQKAAELAVAEAEKAVLDLAREKKMAEDATKGGSEQVKKLAADLKAAESKLAAVEGAKKKLEEELILAKSQAPPSTGSGTLPEGLSGKITAVDPKWDFVVLSIGAKSGVLNGGEMSVSRAGKLIGRVKITKVEPAISIGSMIKAWKKGEVMEGDVVSVVKY